MKAAATVGLFLVLALVATITMAQMPPMPMPMSMQPPHPMPMQPPPPYNMYGPVSQYAASSNNPMMYPPMPPPPQQMVPPPPGPYPAGTSVSFSTAPMYPMMAAAAVPYPAYGMPSQMMMPPPYQTYSGSGPNGDPFTSTAGICKYSSNLYQSPIAPLFNGFYQKAGMGMICAQSH